MVRSHKILQASDTMDRLKGRFRFSIFICCMVYSLNCVPKFKSIEFIYINEILIKMDSLDIPRPEQVYDLERFLYLSPKVIDLINNEFPVFLSKNYENFEAFEIHENDITFIKLDKEYSRIEDFIEDNSVKVSDLLLKNLGMERIDVHIEPRVCVFENSAFVEFISGNEVRAYRFQLTKTNEIQIGFVWRIVS